LLLSKISRAMASPITPAPITRKSQDLFVMRLIFHHFGLSDTLK
jgi:hypothetical protein